MGGMEYKGMMEEQLKCWKKGTKEDTRGRKVGETGTMKERKRKGAFAS